MPEASDDDLSDRDKVYLEPVHNSEFSNKFSSLSRLYCPINDSQDDLRTAAASTASHIKTGWE